MRKWIILCLLLGLLALPVNAMDYTAPEAPDDALELMPSSVSNFVSDLLTVLYNGISVLQPWLANCIRLCLGVFAVTMLVSMAMSIPGKKNTVVEFAGILSISGLLLQNTQSMISLAGETVTKLSDYGKLLLPVMAMAMASEGAVTSSASLYAGTAIFNTLLSGGIAKVLVPAIYLLLVLAVAAGATDQPLLGRLKDSAQHLIAWCLKTVLIIFTGYMTVTGVVSGSTDAMTMKATKLTISSMIPVVGSILSDASEAVVVGAGVMKNAVGIYGMIALVAILVSPFLKMGLLYLLLKLTAALCSIFGVKSMDELIKSFTSSMGLLLAMVGAVCLLFLISVVCFMKGVN